MSEQVNAIYKYYTDLEYDKKWNNDVFINVSTLSEEMTFEDVNDFSERFLKTASVIKKNLSYFKFCCLHIDDVTTIIEYLTNFGMQFSFGSFFDKEYTSQEVVLSVMFTLLSICTDPEVQLFLKNAIINNSSLNMDDKFDNEFLSRSCINEMILLEDSDLYAVVSYLRIKRAKHYLNGIMKIWVHESIKEEFLWLIEEYFTDENIFAYIYKFRSKQELLTSSVCDVINIVSIWSEDIVAAKNLATSLNRDVVFINTYMDFSGGVVLLPFVKIFKETFHKHSKHSLDVCPLKPDAYTTHDTFTNLFYDGMWQQPVKGTYSICKNHGTYNELWANATSDDINKCINSAEKGFKIWSNKSIEARMQILLKFVSLLECNRKFQLANKVSKLVKFLHTYEKSLFCPQNGRLEVTKLRKPRGVIVIKEFNETDLLYHVIESLFAGNSVIVICDFKCSSLACNLSYCDLFSMSNVPPGVVNLLSSENVKTLESILFIKDYESYAKQFFRENNDLSTYMNLTLPKQIILSLK